MPPVLITAIAPRPRTVREVSHHLEQGGSTASFFLARWAEPLYPQSSAAAAPPVLVERALERGQEGREASGQAESQEPSSSMLMDWSEEERREILLMCADRLAAPTGGLSLSNVVELFAGSRRLDQFGLEEQAFILPNTNTLRFFSLVSFVCGVCVFFFFFFLKFAAFILLLRSTTIFVSDSLSATLRR
jgi:hypothetical protein